MMKRRDQRRALPAERHIATAKVPDHRHAGMRGNLVIVANLQRMRRIACGSCQTVWPWQPIAMMSAALSFS
jgi:hypothetical protein